MKDDSAENGMPLAFLISAFCRPLSANARARARYRRTDSAARSFGNAEYSRGKYTYPVAPARDVAVRATFSIFVGAPPPLSSLSPSPFLFFAHSHSVPHPRRKNYSVPKRDASCAARNYEKHAAGIAIAPLFRTLPLSRPCRICLVARGPTYYRAFADNKITIDTARTDV